MRPNHLEDPISYGIGFQAWAQEMQVSFRCLSALHQVHPYLLGIKVYF